MSQLPKQTIERIEREAKKHAGSDGLTYGYTCGATREALLVLPVLEAANEIKGQMKRSGMDDSKVFGDLYEMLDTALTNYEQGTVK